MSAHQGNPFSTRYVQPGAMAYQFPAGERAERLLDRLRDNGWWGQIVGPHGAGKTTLLHTLAPHLTRAGRDTCWCTLKTGQRSLPADLWQQRPTWHAQSLVVIDGYEQLGWIARSRLKHGCRRARAGLLVTSHGHAGLPLLYRVQCPLATVQQLVRQLLREPSHSDRDATPHPNAAVVCDDDVLRTYQQWKGNVREVFFSLYDLYESRRHDR